MFSIETPRRVYIIKVESPDDAKQWKDAIKEASDTHTQCCCYSCIAKKAEEDKNEPAGLSPNSLQVAPFLFVMSLDLFALNHLCVSSFRISIASL